MLDIGKLILYDARTYEEYRFSSMLDIGKLIRARSTNVG